MTESDCEHQDFEGRIEVTRILAKDGDAEAWQFTADVTVRCVGCGELFGFRGPPGGFSWHEPRCTVDGRKISLPLMSPAELALAGPLPVFDRGPMIYEVNP